MTFDWRQLLLDKMQDHQRELEPDPTADQMEAWTDGLASVIADVIDLKRASEVEADGQEAALGYGI